MMISLQRRGVIGFILFAKEFIDSCFVWASSTVPLAAWRFSTYLTSCGHGMNEASLRCHNTKSAQEIGKILEALEVRDQG